MPTYEYQCAACGGEFEAFHSMKVDPLKDCELCDAKGTVTRKIGLGAGIIFKGSGFYETDFKDKKGSSASSTSESAKSGGETSSASTSSGGDAKTSKKADSKPSVSTSTAD
jgi:putative FmdB family regulatory protein